MKLHLSWFCVALALATAGCGDSRHSEASAPTTPPPTTATPEPGSASGEPPAVTASSAAASAPECKDMVKADPKTCRPGEASGDPNAK